MGTKIIVTQDDLDENPSLLEEGVKVGDELELGPLCDEGGNTLSDDPQDPPGEGGPGGTNPPTNPPKP